jgi:hypothetical protein
VVASVGKKVAGTGHSLTKVNQDNHQFEEGNTLMPVDWRASEEKLYAASIAAIRKFARERSEQPVCFFAFDANPRYGDVQIAFDTLENNIRSAKELEQFAIERRERMLSGEDAWQSAKYFLGTPVLDAFNTDMGDFAFKECAKIQFPDWEELAEEGGYPVGADYQDDYVDSSARLVMWRVAKRLVAEEAFKVLRLDLPFMVGYGIHDEEDVILYLLNWP